MNDQEIIYNEDVVNFVSAGNDFISLVENAGKHNRDEFISQSIEVLSNLYLKAFKIKKYEIQAEEDSMQTFVNQAQWGMIQNSIAQILEEYDEYVEIQDQSIDRSIDYLNISLSELFADIYQDIGNLIAAFKLLDTEIMNNAIYFAMQHFEDYWGVRTTTLINSLHKIKFIKVKDN